MKRFEKKIRHYLWQFLGLFVFNFFVMLFLRIFLSTYYIGSLIYLNFFDRFNFWVRFNLINTFVVILPLGISLGLLLTLRIVEIYGVVVDA